MSIIDTFYAMMFYGNYMCISVLLGGIFPFPTPPLLYMTPSSPPFITNIPVIYIYMYRSPIILCLIVFVLLLLSVHVAFLTNSSLIYPSSKRLHVYEATGRDFYPACMRKG